MAEVIVAQRMWQRRGTAAEWTAANPVLARGEIGVEHEIGATTVKIKIGSGDHVWTALPYFGGGGGGDGSVQMRVSAGYIQYSSDGGATWENVIATADLKGDPGDDGTPGDDGREVQLQANATHIQWRYTGDPTYTNLVALSTLKGDPGPAGGPSQVITVSGTSVTLSAASHKGKWIEHQGGELRLPETAAAGFAKDDVVEVIFATSTATTFIKDTAAVTIDFNSTLFKLQSRYAGGAVVIKVTDVNKYRLIGALADA